MCFTSRDDNLRVPNGLTVTNWQAPLLMDVGCSIALSDHDWVVTRRHTFIRSVYTVIENYMDGLNTPKAVVHHM